jgi:tetrapyrrole methylase family protein / MazG family protein
LLPSKLNLELDVIESNRSFEKLIEIMALLRSPEGCPWDRKQDHKSLRQHLLEEAYEVIETIDQEKYSELSGELGDLLLQVVFHAQMASEEKMFDIYDVVESINSKLIRRHPHVFEDYGEITAEEQVSLWEKSKLKKEGKKSAIDGVPKELPALLRAYRMQNKAAAVGFDWPEVEPVWGKISEEIDELKQAVQNKNKDEIEDELGDLLFSVVNLSRFLKSNPEDALRRTIEKFERRFKGVEKRIADSGRSIMDASLEEMDHEWDNVKLEEKSE